jgi:hypothetical protein
VTAETLGEADEVARKLGAGSWLRELLSASRELRGALGARALRECLINASPSTPDAQPKSKRAEHGSIPRASRALSAGYIGCGAHFLIKLALINQARRSLVAILGDRPSRSR